MNTWRKFFHCSNMTTNSLLPDLNKMWLYGRIILLFRYQFRLIGVYGTSQRRVNRSCPLCVS